MRVANLLNARARAGRLATISWLLLSISGSAAYALDDRSIDDLLSLSIDDLSNVQIISVSKTVQPLSDAPAAVYVISHDDIARSGTSSLPEMLRLAPNLQVAQMTANSYAITARGFNGNAANKLLVLIDGRSIYTPLYGGVLWDEKDVLPENIDRIEVISGPGATLWGANAVNGVINIVTRKAADTPGGVLSVGVGNRETRASLQYGGALADDLRYRVYAEQFTIPHGKDSTGADAADGWNKAQGGFRLDWTPAGDAVTLQGDFYDGSEGPAGLDQDIRGGNLQVNWQHQLADGSSVEVLGYYDATRRYSGPFGYSLDTFDVEAQHSFAWGNRQEIVWGAGYRAYQDKFNFAGSPVQFLPEKRTVSLGDIFVQDSVALASSLKLIVGLKLEADPFSSIEPLPSARLSWKADDDVLLWAAVSRAVRAPTRFDVDLNDVIIPSVLILNGNRDFRPEKLSAYEAGTRIQISSAASFSVSAFYNVYDDLRSTEWVNMVTLPLLWTYGNMLEGHTYGVEAWGSYAVTDWWKLAAGFNVQHQDLRFKPGSSALGGVATAGDDPRHQASLRSSMNLGRAVTWDADLRWIGKLPDPKIPAYAELNTRLGWNISDTLQISLSGLNLLHKRHLEYEQAGATIGGEVPRSFFVETQWRF